jgi:hypothetical protein
MFPRTKNRKAISAVLTTLIILVASVVLGTGVVLYGTSLFQTNSQSSGLAVQGAHVWINATSGMTTTYVWGAAEIRNSGDKILSVDQINVRGTQVPFSNWYVDNNQADVTAANYQSQLNYTGTSTAGGTSRGLMTTYIGASTSTCSLSLPTGFCIYEFGRTVTSNPLLQLTQASGPISLPPGAKAIVYFQVPNGVLSTVDAGSSASVSIYAGNVGAPQSVTAQSQT